MSESKHTPGPWQMRNRPYDAGRAGQPAQGEGRYGKPHISIDAGKMASFGVYTGGYWNPETNQGFHIAGIMSEADARLIVAAPDLLEALQKIEPHLYIASDIACIARAAITKATATAP